VGNRAARRPAVTRRTGRWPWPWIIAIALPSLVLGVGATIWNVHRVASDLAPTHVPGTPAVSESAGPSWYFRIGRGEQVIRIDAQGVSERVTTMQQSSGRSNLPSWSRFRTPPAQGELGVHRSEIAIGWPLPAMAALVEWPPQARFWPYVAAIEGRLLIGSSTPWPPRRQSRDTPPMRDSPPVMPMRILWRGFLVDSLISAAVFALVLSFVALAIMFARSAARRRRGRCLRCGYDLRHDLNRGCPECGWARDEVGAGRSS